MAASSADVLHFPIWGIPRTRPADPRMDRPTQGPKRLAILDQKMSTTRVVGWRFCSENVAGASTQYATSGVNDDTSRWQGEDGSSPLTKGHRLPAPRSRVTGKCQGRIWPRVECHDLAPSARVPNSTVGI